MPPPEVSLDVRILEILRRSAPTPLNSFSLLTLLGEDTSPILLAQSLNSLYAAGRVLAETAGIYRLPEAELPRLNQAIPPNYSQEELRILTAVGRELSSDEADRLNHERLRGQTEHMALLDDAVPFGPSLEERITRIFEVGMPNGTLSMASIRHYLRVMGWNGSIEDVARVVDRMVEFGQLMVEPGSGYRLPQPEPPTVVRAIPPDYSQAELRILTAYGRELSSDEEDRLSVLEHRVIAVLRTQPNRSWMTATIRDDLGYRPETSEPLAVVLAGMAQAGLLERAPEGGWRLPQPEDPTEPRPTQSFMFCVQRALAGQDWVSLDTLYARMLVEGWEPPEVREGMSLEQTRRRLLGFQVRRLSTVETEGMYPSIRFRLRLPQEAVAGLPSGANLALPPGLEAAIVRLLDRAGRSMSALEIANHLSLSEPLNEAFAHGGSAEVANGPVLNTLLASPRIVGIHRQGEMQWRLPGVVLVDPGQVEQLIQVVWGQGSVQLYSSDMYRIIGNSAEMGHLSYDQFEDILVEGIRLRRIAQEWLNEVMLYQPWPSTNPRLSDHIRGIFPGVSDEEIEAAARVVHGPARAPEVLSDRILQLFENNLLKAMSFEDIERGLGNVQHSELRGTLGAMIQKGQLYFLSDQSSDGYRLVKVERTGEMPTAWDRLKKGEPDF